MEIHNRTAFAHVLTLSGIFGIAVAMCVIAYQMALQDPVFLGGSQVPPNWTTVVFTTLLGGSLVVLFYSIVIDEVLHGWYDIVTGAALFGQWGVPIGIYLSRNSGNGGLIGFTVILSSILAVLSAIAIAVNYARRCWPKFGGRISAVLSRFNRN